MFNIFNDGKTEAAQFEYNQGEFLRYLVEFNSAVIENSLGYHELQRILFNFQKIMIIHPTIEKITGKTIDLPNNMRLTYKPANKNNELISYYLTETK